MRHPQWRLTIVIPQSTSDPAESDHQPPSLDDDLCPSSSLKTLSWQNFPCNKSHSLRQPTDSTGQSHSRTGEQVACYKGLPHATGGGGWDKKVFSLLLLVREASRQKPSSQFQPLQTSKRTSRNEPERSSWHTTVSVVTAAPPHRVCSPVSLHKLFATGPRPSTEMKSKHLEAAVRQGNFIAVKSMRTFFPRNSSLLNFYKSINLWHLVLQQRELKHWLPSF